MGLPSLLHAIFPSGDDAFLLVLIVGVPVAVIFSTVARAVYRRRGAKGLVWLVVITAAVLPILAAVLSGDAGALAGALAGTLLVALPSMGLAAWVVHIRLRRTPDAHAIPVVLPAAAAFIAGLLLGFAVIGG